MGSESYLSHGEGLFFAIRCFPKHKGARDFGEQKVRMICLHCFLDTQGCVCQSLLLFNTNITTMYGNEAQGMARSASLVSPDLIAVYKVVNSDSASVYKFIWK